MGQYFKIVNFNKNEYIQPSSLKLMEFSYTHQQEAAQLFHLLQNQWKNDRVVVLGDYYAEIDFKEMNQHHFPNNPAFLEEKRSEDDAVLYHYFQNDNPNVKCYEIKNDLTYQINVFEGVAVNHTKKQYVNYKNGVYEYSYAFIDDVTTFKGVVAPIRIDPLMLLLSVNPRGGGGGYFSAHGEEYLSSWVGDQIEVTNSLSANISREYQEIHPDFSEEEYSHPYNEMLIDGVSIAGKTEETLLPNFHKPEFIEKLGGILNKTPVHLHHDKMNNLTPIQFINLLTKNQTVYDFMLADADTIKYAKRIQENYTLEVSTKVVRVGEYIHNNESLLKITSKASENSRTITTTYTTFTLNELMSAVQELENRSIDLER